MHKICVDFDFDEEKIDEYLKLFEIEEKYKDIPAYEWQTTKTKEQKAMERRKKLLDATRARRQEEKKQRWEESRKARKEERDKRYEQSKLEYEQRRLKFEEQAKHREALKQKREAAQAKVRPAQRDGATLVYKKKGEIVNEENIVTEETPKPE